MATEDLARSALQHLLALVAAPQCVACGAGLPGAAEVLCAQCRRALPWLPADRCPRCALPRPCGGHCPARAAAFSRAWAAVAYEGSARLVIGALKFRAALGVADLMAAQIAAGAPPDLLADDATLVPVPTHPARRRARGFDQAQRLAAALAQRTGRPLSRCLRRRGRATRQLGAGRAERLTEQRLELVIVGAPPARAVLVDDVYTTGATLNRCAKALREAGTAEVVAIAYARTLR